jgi:hypothetical protein
MKALNECSDYDSMGDFSRFPAEEKRKSKKYFDLLKFFRIFVKIKK